MSDRPCTVKLEGVRALVTGGSSDIGQVLCRRLAAAGADVAFTYFSDHDGAEAARAAVESEGRHCEVLRANFREDAAADAVVAEVKSRWGAVDVLVHNAASGIFREVKDLKPRHWDWCLKVNTTSLYTLARGLLAGDEPLLNQGGRIIALSSLGGSKAIPQYAAIGASKAAIESLIRHLSVEVGPRSITCNAISPGIVETRALEHFPNKAHLLEVASSKTAMGRLVVPDDVAELVLFLCSDAAGMIHGQTIHLDGGYTAVA